jgi:[NiFe] hydrogenase diaphorase moiety large subunit
MLAERRLENYRPAIDLNFFAFLPLNITLHSGDLALGLVLTQSKPGATRQAMLHCDSRIHDGTRLVQILREAQEQLGWLAPETLLAIAAGTGRSVAQVRSTAAFYSFFNTEAPVRYRALFSDNITDRMLGSEALLDQLCRELLIEPGHRSEDGRVSVDTTSCTGLCDQGPALLINGVPLTAMTPARIDQIAALIRDGVPLTHWPAEFFHIEDNIRRRGPLLDHGLATGEALQAALRGRGGAGFKTATKWASCRKAEGEAHYVVCNADEGEPGTFKDRVLLNSHADLVFEGMTVCARVIGARQGLLYLRGEYRTCTKS